MKKKLLLAPSTLPNFNLVSINNSNTYKYLNILDYINVNNPYIIFRLFFINKLLNKLVKFIN